MPPLRPLSSATGDASRRVCAIHQPHYLPWLPYVDKLMRADVFVALDDVQYTKNGWQNRNRLKGPQGPFTITVPVRKPYGQRICDVEIADEPWARSHLSAIQTSYGRAPGYPRLVAAIAPILERPPRRLADLSLTLLRAICEMLAVDTRIVRSSELNVDDRSTGRLAAICTAVGATHYLTGRHAARTYLDVPLLRTSGLDVLYHRWTAPEYDQPHPRAGFAADMSIVDLLAARPDDAAGELTRAGGVDEQP